MFSGLTNPTAVRFASDGRVFVAEKSGRILLFDNLEDTTPTLFADLRTSVQDFWDRGLLGLELDPGFPTKPYVYVLYTFDAAIGGTAPRWGDQCPSPPGATNDGCVVSGRVSRLQASGNTMTAEKVLVEAFGQQYPSHSVGALAFGSDGALYVSAGDGASFTFVDYGQDGSPTNPLGDPPVAIGGTQTPPTARGGALRSQSLRRPAGEPVLLNGAILRINPETGAALSDNPLATHASANAARIVSYGLRNPFRFAVRPGTDEVWVGDVGAGDWEEINRFSVAGSVENFGWPCYEGGGRQGGFDGANLDMCETLYATAGAHVAPHFAYHHANKVVANETCGTGSSSIAGMAFYKDGNYPPEYKGALFFSDYSRQCTWVMFPDATGTPTPSRIANFVTSAAAVDLQTGPGGDLFYVDIAGGAIRRVRYLAPTARATASPTTGPAPLAVSFDGRSSTPGTTGDTLTFAWDLDGDGAFDDGTASTASFTYTAAGSYTARLRVTDSRGATSVSAPLTIQAGQANTAPTPTIATPAAGTTWSVGQVLSFSGSATDSEDGTLAASALTWTLVMQHCPSTCHEHVIQTFPGVASGSFTAEDHDYPSHLELRLTATDRSGAQTTVSRRLDPRTIVLTMQAQPATSPALQVSLGLTTAATPFQRTVIVGSTNSVSAPTPQTIGGTVYDFVSWSDAGSNSHNVTAGPSNTTLTATYRARSGAGTGLTGEYWDNVDFTGTKVTRTDAIVDFDWATGAPAPGLGADTFSVRWTGKVQARATERVTFYTTSDDGVRLWVNGIAVIDNWTDHGATENSGSIDLVAGQQYDIRMEMYERGGNAVAKLHWAGPSFAREVVPMGSLFPSVANPTGTGLTGEYHDNVDFTGTKVVRTDATVNFDWGNGAPATAIDVDTFSVRWTGKVQARATERVTFYTTSDDGVRLWVNGVLVIDNWTDHSPREDIGSIDLVAGVRYDIRMEMYERHGGAVARLHWSGPSFVKEVVPTSHLYPAQAATGGGTGLKGEYWDNVDFTGTRVARTDSTVNFDWGTGAPIPGIDVDTFSVRWTGKVQARATERVTFYTTSDDGVRLWVNGVAVINNWTDHSATEDIGSIELVGGIQYEIRMEMYEKAGQAAAKLHWSAPSFAREVVPMGSLFPAP